MEGYGPEKLLETIYGKNTVTHMSGKATSGELRGHFLVDASLRIKLLASACIPETLLDNVKSEFHLKQESNVDTTNSELYVSTEEVHVIMKMYEQLCNGEIVVESVEEYSLASVKKKENMS